MLFSDYHQYGSLATYCEGGIRDETIVRTMAAAIAKGISQMHKVILFRDIIFIIKNRIRIESLVGQ